MLVKFVAASAALLVSVTLGFAADPVGHYRIAGANPGGGDPYAGIVIVERTGETYRVTWSVGGLTYVGTGIGNDKGLAVSYQAGSQTGIAIYLAEGNGWKGAWTYSGGRTLGAEAWTR